MSRIPGHVHTVGAYKVHAGDEIATRHNDRRLTTNRGEMVRNRAWFKTTAAVYNLIRITALDTQTA